MVVCPAQEGRIRKVAVAFGFMMAEKRVCLWARGIVLSSEVG